MLGVCAKLFKELFSLFDAWNFGTVHKGRGLVAFCLSNVKKGKSVCKAGTAFRFLGLFTFVRIAGAVRLVELLPDLSQIHERTLLQQMESTCTLC